MLRASLEGSGLWGRMGICICMAESLCYSPETTKTLLIGYTPIQNKKFKVWEKIKVVTKKKILMTHYNTAVLLLCGLNGLFVTITRKESL